MNTLWILVGLLCCLSQSILDCNGQLTEEPTSGVSLSVDINDEVQRAANNSNMISNRYYYSSCPTHKDSNGIYTIEVFGLEPFEVLCNSDLAGPGWTVIASRSNGDLNFFRNWAEYKRGFGSLTGDFFIGLDKLHAITVSQPQELYVYLEDFDGKKRFARYDEFLIGTETDKYVMAKLGTYIGDLGDSLRRNVDQKFSTYDNNNDRTNDNCPASRIGAWWYIGCTDVNLFGLYLNGAYDVSLEKKGIFWYSWRQFNYSYKVMRMMVKPKCSCSL